MLKVVVVEDEELVRKGIVLTVDWAGAGASVPLLGFGNAIAAGMRDAVAEKGLLGVFTGGFTAAAGGVCAAILFGYLAALLGKPKEKK